MNISTGGPHILLFERDQQLATLLISELQLAGYACYAARTAVEVFDAIARRPVRLVLVNLAQAAASRREFWVALDTQRRGSGVQVYTFHCSNLAGYGPHDADELDSTSQPDLEVDGMAGLTKLIEAVRTRVPGPGMEENAGTMPRLPRASLTSNATVPMAAQRAPAPPPQTGNGFFVNRNAPPGNGFLNPLAMRNNLTPTPPPRTTPTSPTPEEMEGAGTGQNSQSLYNEKIRAVLYPNQRNWNTNQNAPSWQEVRPVQETSMYSSQQPSDTNLNLSPSPNMSAPADTPVLQRLANGLAGLNNDPNESGLAQLSRLARSSAISPQNNSGNIVYQPAEMQQVQEKKPIEPPMPVNQAPPIQIIQFSESASPPHTVPPVRQTPISAQPLRAAPIQDLPNDRISAPERPAYNQSMAGPSPITTGQLASSPLASINTRPETPVRGNYSQPLQNGVQSPAPSIPSQLASINTAALNNAAPHAPSVSQSLRRETGSSIPEKVLSPPPVERRSISTPPPRIEQSQPMPVVRPQSPVRPVQIQPVALPIEAPQPPMPVQTQTAATPVKSAEEGEFDSISSHNAVILDILQSLPPIPNLSQHEIQAQILHGRAQRSLGSVLLDGHLVPQDRLEVAQNIQRMLRGVDLNYQLGDILLMFKLLTPDQLLAASLVSYGLITTAQISTLGRIRQELHAIGLEYDLENLLILFRMLTPEQLREARLNVQT